ncbi:hypothetical protein N7493_006923 [Penicillium malachiteum]|uniref:Uncharacterized protein n=1 Tax=Penicillium malachiteum TaxID=1324776 RepID=A0AAD6HJK6_9EURO|nr:hypothetical protein N7493_006923 [Penicillium malachiteum]
MKILFIPTLPDHAVTRGEHAADRQAQLFMATFRLCVYRIFVLDAARTVLFQVRLCCPDDDPPVIPWTRCSTTIRDGADLELHARNPTQVARPWRRADNLSSHDRPCA